MYSKYVHLFDTIIPFLLFVKCFSSPPVEIYDSLYYNRNSNEKEQNNETDFNYRR